MRWQDYRRSENVEDRRGMSAAKGGGLGIGGLIIVGLISVAFGVDPRILLGIAENVGGGGAPQQQEGVRGAPTDEKGGFAASVLAATEDTWNKVFQDKGQTYQKPDLVLFNDAVASKCGFAQSATGPFYCPLDKKIYIDLSFFDDLSKRFGASGDGAAAYVIAHEVGHHVQNLLGVLPRVQAQQRSEGGARANAISVRAELQADCYAGFWARGLGQQYRLFDESDIQEAIVAADAIGDDRLQRKSQGRVTPDSFTHGTSAQRVRWFTTGTKASSIEACDTFQRASF